MVSLRRRKGMMYGIIMGCLLSNNALWSIYHVPAVGPDIHVLVDWV